MRLFVLIIAALTSALEPYELDYSNFETFVASRKSGKVTSQKPWFIKFAAPWCGHCKKMKPMWEEFHEKNQDWLNVGDVDCTSEYG